MIITMLLFTLAAAAAAAAKRCCQNDQLRTRQARIIIIIISQAKVAPTRRKADFTLKTLGFCPAIIIIRHLSLAQNCPSRMCNRICKPGSESTHVGGPIGDLLLCQVRGIWVSEGKQATVPSAGGMLRMTHTPATQHYCCCCCCLLYITSKQARGSLTEDVLQQKSPLLKQGHFTAPV